MFHTTREIDLLDRGLDKRGALIEPLENLHTGSKRGNFISRLPSAAIMMMLITLSVALSAKQAMAAPTQITACQTITLPGSYVLANDISAGSGDCLVVNIGFVTIDLNGFSMFGNFTGTGIRGTAFNKGITIRNGSIRNFATGVNLVSNSDSFVERMYVTDNKDSGVLVGGSSIVRDNIITDNGSVGLSVGNSLTRGTILTGNTVARNGIGVEAGTGSIVIGNASTINKGDGFQIGSDSVVINNVATNNMGSMNSGFNVFANSVVENNAANQNHIGFTVACPSKVSDNTAGGNGLVLYGSGCIDKDNVP